MVECKGHDEWHGATGQRETLVRRYIRVRAVFVVTHLGRVVATITVDHLGDADFWRTEDRVRSAPYVHRMAVACCEAGIGLGSALLDRAADRVVRNGRSRLRLDALATDAVEPRPGREEDPPLPGPEVPRHRGHARRGVAEPGRDHRGRRPLVQIRPQRLVAAVVRLGRDGEELPTHPGRFWGRSRCLFDEITTASRADLRSTRRAATPPAWTTSLSFNESAHGSDPVRPGGPHQRQNDHRSNTQRNQTVRM